MQRLFVSTSLKDQHDDYKKRRYWKDFIINESRDQNFLFWKKYGMLHKLYDVTSYTGCRLLSAPTLTSQSYKCIKPQSSVQYLEHKREFGEPDLCLLNQTTILPWFTSESDDSNTKIGQLVCSERLFQNYGIYWIDNRQLIYVQVWWLRSDDCSALFKLLSMSLVYQPSCSSIHFPLHIAMLRELCMIIPTPHPVLILIDDSSGSCIYCFTALQAMVSWADTFNGHSLTSVRSDRGGDYLLDDDDFGVAHHSSILPSTRCRWMSLTSFTPLPILHIHNEHIERFIRTLPLYHLLTIFFIDLHPSSMTPIWRLLN